MGFYDTEEGARQYMEMAEGYDGRDLMPRLGEYLPQGSSVLELGMGPGKDLDLLREDYAATGSDMSLVFLRLYREAHEDADVIALDAVTIATDRAFDCIYSNKVLHHLSVDQLRTSIGRQHEVLSAGGLLFHTFWKGEGAETIQGMLFTYQNESGLREFLDSRFEVLVLESYAELEADDSLLLICRKV